jgi:hypothetical protein
MPWRRRGGVDDPRIRNLGAKYEWAFDAKPRPLQCTVPIAQEAGWAAMPVWTDVEKRKRRVLTGVRSLNIYKRIFPLILHRHMYTTTCKCYPETCLENSTLAECCMKLIPSLSLKIYLIPSLPRSPKYLISHWFHQKSSPCPKIRPIFLLTRGLKWTLIGEITTVSFSIRVVHFVELLTGHFT